MVAIISFTIFASALGVSVAVITAMIAPQWRRIVSLVTGRAEPRFAPLAVLVMAERRVAVQRWSSQSIPSSLNWMREAA